MTGDLSARSAPRRAGPWAAVAIAALALALYPDAVFRGRAFYERDVHLVWHAQVEAFVRAVLSGSWPVWNPYLSFGHPMLANPHTQVLYPFTWLNLILRPTTFYTVFVVAHTAFAGWGLFLLARRLGLSTPAAWVAAACWMASGPFLSLGNMWIQMAGASWVPWVLLAGEHALASRAAVPMLLWGGAVALQLLAGSPDMSVMTVAAAAARAAWWLWPRAGRWPDPRDVVRVAAAAAFAVLLSAGLWLPALDLTRQAARWSLGSTRAVWSVHPLGLAEIVSPVPLTDLPLNAGARGILYDGGAPLVRSLYLGIPALALVAAALAGSAGAVRRAVLVGLLGAVVFALGRHTALYEIAVGLVPPLRMLRYPSKATALVAFAWAVLAGMGFDAWSRAEAIPRRRWLSTVLAPVLALAAAGAAAAALLRWRPKAIGAVLLPPHDLSAGAADILAQASLRVALTVGLAAIVVAAAAIRLARPRAARALAGAVAAVAILDLAAAGIHVNPTVPLEFYKLRPPILETVSQDDLSRLYVYRYPFLAASSTTDGAMDDPYRVTRSMAGLSFDAARTLAARLYVTPPVSGCWGLFASYEPDLIGLYPAHLAEVTRWMAQAEATPAWSRWLRIGAVRHVSALRRHGGFEDLSAVAVYPSLLARPILLLEVPGTLPRTYAVGTARAADGDRARQVLADPGFDPAREVVLPDTSLQAGPAFSGRTRIVGYKADRVRIEAELSEPGIVVLVDTYDPGWAVTVDGQPAALLRANVAFRGVKVPAGKHVIEHVYRPWTVRYGLGASAAAVLGALCVVVLRYRRAAAAIR